MNLTDVIATLVEERGLEREKIVEIICDGVCIAYQKKYPEFEFEVSFNTKAGQAEVFVKKTVVKSVKDDTKEISAKKAKVIKTRAKEGDEILVPFEESVGRIEIASAKQIIANRIRDIEQLAIFNDFKDKEGSIISGMTHKRERGGLVVKIGEHMAFLPRHNIIPNEPVRIGYPIKALFAAGS